MLDFANLTAGMFMKNTESAKISDSMEDYLEAIAALQKANGSARVNEIGKLLGVKNPSVNSAVSNLSDLKLVRHERYGRVELTPAGAERAGRIQKKHEMLYKFLTGILNVDAKTADRDACRMEHSLSAATTAKLVKFIEFIEGCPEEDGPEWLLNLRHYLKTGARKRCERSKRNV